MGRTVTIDLDQVQEWARSVDVGAMSRDQVVKLLGIVADLLESLHEDTGKIGWRLVLAAARAAIVEWRRQLKRGDE